MAYTYNMKTDTVLTFLWSSDSSATALGTQKSPVGEESAMNEIPSDVLSWLLPAAVIQLFSYYADGALLLRERAICNPSFQVPPNGDNSKSLYLE